VFDVVILSLADPPDAGTVRVPVRACADALVAAGVRVEAVTATSDDQIDAVLARLDGPVRPDGLTWPDPAAGSGAGAVRLVAATAADSQVRAVVRRMVRRWAPPPSRRPPELPAGRSVPDLPPVGVLPLDPAGTAPARDLAAQLGLPREPAAVAQAVVDGRVRRLDLLRTDAGSVTLDGILLGGTDAAGRAVAWRGRVEVDDAVLSTGEEPLLTAVVANAGGYARVDGLPLVERVDPGDASVQAAVAVPIRTRWRRKVRVEVRRARGRAVAVSPAGGAVACLDDGVADALSRKRTWWVEPSAWAVYAS
jgi:hypothetical protein